MTVGYDDQNNFHKRASNAARSNNNDRYNYTNIQSSLPSINSTIRAASISQIEPIITSKIQTTQKRDSRNASQLSSLNENRSLKKRRSILDVVDKIKSPMLN